MTKLSEMYMDSVRESDQKHAECMDGLVDALNDAQFVGENRVTWTMFRIVDGGK